MLPVGDGRVEAVTDRRREKSREKRRSPGGGELAAAAKAGFSSSRRDPPRSLFRRDFPVRRALRLELLVLKYEYIIMGKEKGKKRKEKPITWESEFYRPPAPPLRRMRSFQIRRNPGCQRPNRLLLALPWRSRLRFGRYPRRFDYYRNFLLLKKVKIIR